jgi:hypothetical protein
LKCWNPRESGRPHLQNIHGKMDWWWGWRGRVPILQQLNRALGTESHYFTPIYSCITEKGHNKVLCCRFGERT